MSEDHSERQPLLSRQETERTVENGPENASRISGPDGYLSWLVACACHVILFIIGGLGRLFALIFVELIERYNVNRQAASLPFCVHLAVKNISGPLAGYLGHKIGVRSTIVLGGIISTCSIGACYVFDSFNSIVILWGAINGFGSSLSTTLIPVIIDQYFHYLKATAMGLSFLGGCFGAVAFPAVLGNLIHVHGMKSYFFASFLIVMFTIPVGLIFKKPPWMRRNEPSTVDNNEAVEIGGINPLPNSPPRASVRNPRDNPLSPKQYPNIQKLLEHKDLAIKVLKNIIPEYADLEQMDFDLIEPWQNFESHVWPELEKLFDRFQAFAARESVPTERRNPSENNCLVRSIRTWWERSVDVDQGLNTDNQSNSETEDLEKSNEHYRDLVMLKLKTLTIKKLTDISTVCLHENVNNLLKVTNEFRKLYHIIIYLDKIEEFTLSEEMNAREANAAEENTSPENVPTLSNFELCNNVLFYFVCLNRAVHFITFISVMTTVVDFMKDSGLEKSYGKYAIISLSAGDAFGRIGMGWVTDCNYLSVQTFVKFLMIIQAFVTLSLPFMPNTTMVILELFIFGIIQGSLFIRHPILVTKYTSEHQHSKAMGYLNFLSGIVACGLPSYIGFFRDTLESYDYMFYFNGAIIAFVCILWMFEPRFARYLPTEHLPVADGNPEPAQAL